jgi:SAM-dependent methyltransferase
MTPDERWLAAVWPFVRDNLPTPPARVLEIGCGPLGGFVPRLLADRYAAIGIDPEAPEGPEYRRVEFERDDIPGYVDAVVASASLHHVVDLGVVLDRAQEMLPPAGALVIVEWASERFDDATATWCFDRLAGSGDESDWLAECRAGWRASSEPWDSWCRTWAEQHRLHTWQEISRELDARFECRRLDDGPYYFPGLASVTESEEQAAIDAGRIQANRIQYAGSRR